MSRTCFGSDAVSAGCCSTTGEGDGDWEDGRGDTGNGGSGGGDSDDLGKGGIGGGIGDVVGARRWAESLAFAGRSFEE